MKSMRISKVAMKSATLINASKRSAELLAKADSTISPAYMKKLTRQHNKFRDGALVRGLKEKGYTMPNTKFTNGFEKVAVSRKDALNVLNRGLRKSDGLSMHKIHQAKRALGKDTLERAARQSDGISVEKLRKFLTERKRK